MDDDVKAQVKTQLESLVRVNAALAGLSARERLDVVNLAWLTIASNARTEALITPGGFQEERERQVQVLRAMAVLVSADEPDLEKERHFHEGDIEGLLRHLQSLRDGLDEKGGA
jgi:hypothetical protein